MTHDTQRFCFSLILSGIFFLSSVISISASTEAPKTLAILPFQIHAPEDLRHVQNGMLYMLQSRLTWRDRVHVVSGNQVAAIVGASPHITGNQMIQEVARQTDSDFILTGSITQLAGSFSIDATVYDIPNKRYMAFFEQSAHSNDLINRIDRIAATINQKIFERSTLTWEQMVQEQKAHADALRRKNPEYLMQNPQWQPQSESHGWKIWKYLF